MISVPPSQTYWNQNFWGEIGILHFKYDNMWTDRQNNQGWTNFYKWNKEGAETKNEGWTLSRKCYKDGLSEEATAKWRLEGWEGLRD